MVIRARSTNSVKQMDHSPEESGRTYRSVYVVELAKKIKQVSQAQRPESKELNGEQIFVKMNVLISASLVECDYLQHGLDVIILSNVFMI